MTRDAQVTAEEWVSAFRTQVTNGWKVEESWFENALTGEFWPQKADVFRALGELAPGQVQYLILGQDPYATTYGENCPHATGIAFAVPGDCDDANIPSSLTRIMAAVYGPEVKGRTDLEPWRKANGVLLLNAALTVPRLGRGQSVRDVAGKHLGYWKRFTAGIVAQLVMGHPQAQLIAWGGAAKAAICEAFLVAGKFSYAHHPTVYSKDGKDLDGFWGSDVVKGLAPWGSNRRDGLPFRASNS